MFKEKKGLKIGLIALAAIFLLSAIAFLTYNSLICWEHISDLLETSPPALDETPTPIVTPSAPNGTTTPEIRTFTVTDEDLPEPPITGLTLHFIPPEEGDPGHGKIRAKYWGTLSWSVWFGASEGKLWLYHVPRRESLLSSPSLVEFYDYLGIDENTVYTETDGKYWVTGIPPWLNIAKYDEEITELPFVISVETRDGEATINYMLRQ